MINSKNNKQKSETISGIYKVWYTINKQKYFYIGCSQQILLNVNSIEMIPNFKGPLKSYYLLIDGWYDKTTNAKQQVFNLLKDKKFPTGEGFGLKIFLLAIVYDFDIIRDIRIEILKEVEESSQSVGKSIKNKRFFIQEYDSYAFGFNGINDKRFFIENSKGKHPDLENEDERNRFELKKKLQSEFKINGSNFSKNKFVPWLYYQLFEENEPEIAVWNCFVEEFEKKFNRKVLKK